MRIGEFLGRHGGDEFAAVIPDLQREEDTLEVAHRIVEAMELPFEIEGQSFALGASVGIAISPNDGRVASDLLQNGDSAMYRAKSQGGGQVFLFSAHVRDDLERRRRLVRDLRSAAMSREFLVCYQPIIDLESNATVGAEALVRWLHPLDGLLSADAFLGPINAPKLVALVDAWMIGQTMAQSAKWEHLRRGLRIHVNVGTPDPSIIREIDRLLAVGGIDPHQLHIEINEATIMGEPDHALGFLNECRARGLHTGLDRFSAGPSSLVALARMPIDFVKLDHALIDEASMINGTTAAAIAIANAFGWHLIAQGVSASEQRRWLLARGVREAQGYAIGQPMTTVDFERWLTATDNAAVS